MNIFAKIGELIIKLFDLIGMIILSIPKLPEKIRGINTDDIKNKVDTEALKGNISKIRNTGLEIGEGGISKISQRGTTESPSFKKGTEELQKMQVSGEFTSEEKERTVFKLQIVSGAFLVISMLFLFNFIAFTIYLILGALLISYVLYILFTKIKSMYSADFNAYRDFFLMYIAVGIIIVLVGTNPNFVMAFSFQFFPSLTILIFALISAAAVFLIFRIRYHRNYTFGTVIDVSKKTAYVKVDYDIRSNVKPDVYIVDNTYGASEGEVVKLQIKEKILSNSGNKPVSIIETVK